MPEFTANPPSTAWRSAGGEKHAPAATSDALVELVDLAVQPTLTVALRAVREALGMDVAYISQSVGDAFVVREIEGDGESFALAQGISFRRADTYCQRMLDGRIPNLTPDVRGDDRTASLEITERSNVGAYATVPLTFADGRLYGTLCAASHQPRPATYQHLGVLKVFARLVADQLESLEKDVEVSHLVALVNASGDAIMGLTPTGVVTSWNAASEQIFGYRAEQAIGANIVDLIGAPGRHREMHESLAQVSRGEVVRRIGRRRRADGALIVDDVTLSPIRDEHGEVFHLSGDPRCH